MARKEMSLILTINVGSDSIKVSLFDKSFHIWSAHCKKLLSSSPELEIEKAIVHFSSPLTTSEALSKIIKKLIKFPAFQAENLAAIGHRFVHGGASYSESVIVDDDVISALEQCIPFAPLHNPYGLEGIRSLQKIFPSVAHIAVFDTAFHATIPPHASLYALPYALSEKYHIRRYGFHGISHAYLWDSYARITKKNTGKIITLHLGNGCSMAAIRDGISLDTTMGFTPLEGLIMATRCGDIDAGALTFLQQSEGLSSEELYTILNKKSGLLGISGVSPHMHILLSSKDPRATRAIDVFCYRVRKYLGAYISILEGLDGIVFSGGIGENAPLIRKQIIERMSWYGLTIDTTLNATTKNMSPGDIQRISSEDSTAQIFVIATDENAYIAQQAEKLVR